MESFIYLCSNIKLKRDLYEAVDLLTATVKNLEHIQERSPDIDFSEIIEQKRTQLKEAVRQKKELDDLCLGR